MSDKIKFPSQGISGKLFLAIEFVLLLLIFGAGLFFVAPNSQVVNNTVGGICQHLFEVVVKFGLVFVISLVQVYVVFTHVLDTPLSHLREKFETARNDSHAILLVGIVASVIVALVMAQGTNLHQYIYQLCTRAAVGYAIATTGAVFVARLFGIHSMDEFRDWVDAKDNDSYAILIAGILVLSILLVMSA